MDVYHSSERGKGGRVGEVSVMSTLYREVRPFKEEGRPVKDIVIIRIKYN